MYSSSMFRLAACNRNYVLSTIPTETSNSLCVTTKKNNVFSSSKTIQVGNILYTVPCFLVKHIDELKQLLSKMNISDAIKLLAAKYGINLNPVVQNVKRYKYSIVSIKLIPNVIQFKVSFRLDEKASLPPDQSIYVPNCIHYMNDAKYISVCNDDTVTFSKNISDIVNQSSYWYSTLPKVPNFYVVINNTESNTVLTAQTGNIRIYQDRLVFIPLIFNEFIFLYKPYPTNTSFKFLYSGDIFDAAISIMTDLFDTTQDSCFYRKT